MSTLCVYAGVCCFCGTLALGSQRLFEVTFMLLSLGGLSFVCQAACANLRCVYAGVCCCENAWALGSLKIPLLCLRDIWQTISNCGGSVCQSANATGMVPLCRCASHKVYLLKQPAPHPAGCLCRLVSRAAGLFPCWVSLLQEYSVRSTRPM